MKDLTKLKVVKIDGCLIFDNGIRIESAHNQECCENHYLSFGNLNLEDFEGLEFDLSNDNFFTRIDNFGIALNPINGLPVRIAGYADNNGGYSSNLTLDIYNKDNEIIKTYDISECQEWGD